MAHISGGQKSFPRTMPNFPPFVLPSPALTLGHSNMSVLATVAADIDWATVLAYAFTVMAAYVALTVAAVASPLSPVGYFSSRGCTLGESRTWC